MNRAFVPDHIREYVESHPQNTPYLIIDLDKVAENYRRLSACMPAAHHHYAIKANPHMDVLKRLVSEGGYFEVASINEIDMCIEAGAPADEILYGNPLKKETEIAQAYVRGVRSYVFDNILELEKIARAAPGSKVICRIFADGSGAVSPLTIKFGCPKEKAQEWLRAAKEMGLEPYGLSFHTGSQQLLPSSWEKPMRDASAVFKALKQEGIELRVIDVGGGFPVSYRTDVPSIEHFAAAITEYANAYFETPPLIFTEPGRYMTGDAGHILSEVVLISPNYADENIRWVYLDIGRYGGLVEEKIDYPVLSNKDGPQGPVILAGQTCDSNDVIYRECFNYQLPLNLECGDKVVLAYTGAYTTTYSTTLNGFESLKAITIGETKTMNNNDQCIYPEDFLSTCEFRAEDRALFPKMSDVQRVNCEEFGEGLVAQRDFARGECIGAFTGIPGADIKQHTLQIHPNWHLHDPHFIGFLLHDCDPNCVLDMHSNRIYCIKNIKAGQPLSMDYATTEDVLFKQFPCLCPASNCRLWVTGRAERINPEGQMYLTEYQMEQEMTVSEPSTSNRASG